MALTKNQIQKMILGAIGGAIGIFVILQFIVAPMLGSIRENRETIRTLREQLDKAGDVIGKGAELQRNLNRTRADIRDLTTNMPLPVLGNYLLGREEQIRACCTGLNMQISGVTEHDLLDVAGWNNLFKIYRVRVTGQAGINDLVRFFNAIQKRSPLVSLMALNITPRDDSPAVHNVNFVLAWIIWANPDKRPAFLMETEPKIPAAIPGSKK